MTETDVAPGLIATVLRDTHTHVLSGWTQHVYARNAQGEPTEPDAPDAVCWCPDGALRKAMAPLDLPSLAPLHDAATARIERAVGCAKGYGIEWNDTSYRTHAEVLAALDRAARDAQNEIR